MVLDRDELAARLAVADFANPSFPNEGGGREAKGWADFVVEHTDALLSRLRPSAPDAPASGAPVAAPSPSPEPAATPAAWVPSVGDVVGIDGGQEYGETRVITAVGASVTYVRLNSVGAWLCEHTMDVSLLTYLRPATASERAAAGLPVDESATKPVDREGLARALHVAWWGEQTPATPWDELHPDTQAGWLTAADAAIAFMAKGVA